MSSLFTGTAQVLHKTRLPAGVTRAQAVSMLQDHPFYLSCDPHLVKFEEIKADDPRAKDAAPPPDRVKPTSSTGTAATRYYEVHDLVHNLPGGLWDSNVVSTYEMTDTDVGVFVRIRSPMSVVMDTFWEIKEAEDGDGGALELVEEIRISASRLIVGLVKSLCEGGWQKIHEKMVDRLKRELDGSAQKPEGGTATQTTQSPVAIPA